VTECLGKLRQLLAKTEEGNCKLILYMAQKMARPKASRQNSEPIAQRLNDARMGFEVGYGESEK
jgi:hypothetical protein